VDFFDEEAGFVDTDEADFFDEEAGFVDTRRISLTRNKRTKD
jgi:hypothetical protein